MGIYIYIFIFLAFDFCRFCVVIRGFHPRNNGQWPPTSKDFYTRSYTLHYFLILFLEKEPVFPFLMLSAKQVNYWYHFYNVFGMTRSSLTVLDWDWTRDLPLSKPGWTLRWLYIWRCVSCCSIDKSWKQSSREFNLNKATTIYIYNIHSLFSALMSGRIWKEDMKITCFYRIHLYLDGIWRIN